MELDCCGCDCETATVGGPAVEAGLLLRSDRQGFEIAWMSCCCVCPLDVVDRHALMLASDAPGQEAHTKVRKPSNNAQLDARENFWFFTHFLNKVDGQEHIASRKNQRENQALVSTIRYRYQPPSIPVFQLEVDTGP